MPLRSVMLVLAVYDGVEFDATVFCPVPPPSVTVSFRVDGSQLTVELEKVTVLDT